MYHVKRMLVSFLLLSMTGTSFSGKEEPYADLWKRGTMEEKKLFVSGISLGLSLMKNYTCALIRAGAEDSSAADSSIHGRDSIYIKRAYDDLSFLEQDFVEENVIKAMDVLYRKEKNRDFPFQQMYIIAVKEIRRLRDEKPRELKKY